MTAKCGLCKSNDISGRSEFIISLKDPQGKIRIRLEMNPNLCGQCLEKHEDLISMMPYLFYKMAYIDQDKLRSFINTEFEIEWSKTGKPH
jgi:hypothetical protein